MSLIPTKALEPGGTFEDLIVFIYGPPKIGKSSFAAQAKTLFLATEQGLRSLRRFEVPVDSWVTFKRACKEITDKKPDFKVICIDTVDNLWKMCTDYVCNKKNMDHPSDEKYGKGYDFVKDEFRRVLVKLSMQGYGLWLISHSKDESFETRHRALSKVTPTIPGSARSVVIPMADIIAYLGVEEVEVDGDLAERRIAHFAPSESCEAGDKTGKLPPKMYMGKSPEEFYNKFKKYFTGGKDGNERKGSSRRPKKTSESMGTRRSS